MDETQDECLCQVCSRNPSHELTFLCTSCARAAVYDVRVELVQAVLDRDSARRQVEETLMTGTQPSGALSRHAYDNMRNEVAASKLRYQDLREQADQLRASINEMKADTVKKEAKLMQRHEALKNAKAKATGITTGRKQQLQTDLAAAQRTAEATHKQSSEDRIWRCRLAAQLAGLEQRKRRKGTTERDVYLIGGMPIVDLRDLNSGLIDQFERNTCTNFSKVRRLKSSTAAY